mmetsp:Transcript_94299/g.215740  ORF Transcript_94299/g.215740 Transcript_94299/m.215740 type:complete len:155 (-) Transcript_94299:167-631(-)
MSWLPDSFLFQCGLPKRGCCCSHDECTREGLFAMRDKMAELAAPCVVDSGEIQFEYIRGPPPPPVTMSTPSAVSQARSASGPVSVAPPSSDRQQPSERGWGAGKLDLDNVGESDMFEAAEALSAAGCVRVMGDTQPQFCSSDLPSARSGSHRSR